MGSSAHANNKTRSILVLGKYIIQGIDNTTIYAEKMYSNNFTVANKKFCLSLHYNGYNSYLFVNGKDIINFKSKNSEIVPYPLCIGGLSKDFSPANTHKTDFSVDYWAIANDKILDIHKYLIETNNTFEFIKKIFFTALTLISFSPLNVNSLGCVSVNNPECKIR